MNERSADRPTVGLPPASSSSKQKEGRPVRSPLVLRGDRVRGGAIAQRVPSQKALLRHQVNRSPTASAAPSGPQGAHEGHEPKPSHKPLNAATKGNMEDSDAYVSRQARDLFPESEHPPDSPKSRASHDAIIPLTKVGNHSEDDEDDVDDYESDFELEPSSDCDDKNVIEPNSDYKASMKGEAPNLDAPRQKSIARDWDAKECARQYKMQDQEDVGMSLDDSPDDIGGEETQASVLTELIDEARGRSKRALGDTLFEKVYNLCEQHMKLPVSADGKNEANEGNQAGSFIGELEGALCNHLQGGVETACEAVFGVKVLLALETRLTALLKHDIENERPREKVCI